MVFRVYLIYCILSHFNFVAILIFFFLFSGMVSVKVESLLPVKLANHRAVKIVT